MTLQIKTLCLLLLTPWCYTGKNEEFQTKKRIPEKCDMSRCSDETSIVYEDAIPNDVTIEETAVTLFEYMEEEQLIYTTRSRYKAYCYQGTILDVNTGCDKSEYEVPLTIEEARKNKDSGNCKIGCVCAKNECTGSASDCCLDESLSDHNGDSEYGDVSSDYAFLGRHSCTSKWRCIIRKITVRPIVQIHNGDFIRKVEVADRFTIVFDEEFYTVGKNFNNWVRYYSPSFAKKSPIVSDMKARCYSANEKKIDCVLNVNGNDLVFKIDSKTMIGILRNMAMVIKGSIKTIVDGKIKLIQRIEHPGNGYIVEQSDESERSASVSSLQEALNGVQVIQMQEIYNVITNRNEINSVKNTIHKMITFISKKYPRALSDILGGNYKTKWLNDEVFLRCPCIKRIEIPIFSNCEGNNIYKDGETRPTEHPAEECTSIDERKIKKVHIFSNSTPLDTKEIDYLPPKTSSSEDSSWDWLVHKKAELHDIIEHRIADEKSGFLDEINPYFSFKDSLLYLCTSVSVLWIITRFLERPR